MSFSIKTILKLICLLGLFACTSKSASAQNMEVDFVDVVDRRANNEQRKITQDERVRSFARPNINFSYDGVNYDLTISGIIASQIINMHLASPSGQIYPLDALAIATNLYTLSSLPNGYYTIVIQYTGGVITENIHLQH